MLITNPSTYTTITLFCWLALFSFWFYKARSAKQNTYRQPQLSRTIYLTAIVLCFALLYLPFDSMDWLKHRLVPATDFWGITGVIICAAGIGFAIWARMMLGSNWSGAVTL